MKIGTRSLLFGVHAFWLHPWILAWSWWKLYGFPWDPRLWVAFIVHDMGYWGKPNMDGPEGEQHPWLGALIMDRLFDRGRDAQVILTQGENEEEIRLGWWGRFTLFHSRYLAKRYGFQPSRLCIADKLAAASEPWWLYLPRVWLTGELREFMAEAATERGRAAGISTVSAREWHRTMGAYMRRWVEEHRDGQVDTWTQVRHGHG